MRAHGRARVDPQNPQAFAVCDRCGKRRNHVDLTWQHEWQGNQLVNLRILVCHDTCLDKPHEFTRPPLLPPDPVPIKDPRPERAPQPAPPNVYVQTLLGASLPTPPVGNPKTWTQPSLATDDWGPLLSDSGLQLVPD